MTKKKPKTEAQEQPETEPDVKAPEKPTPDTAIMHTDLQLLKQSVSGIYEELASFVDELAQMKVRVEGMADEMTSIKRKPTSKTRVRIHDKATGKDYPSKNSTYKTMLKAGELKELVDLGIFGPTPEKNSFGWYALVRAWPDRFEEVKSADETRDSVSEAQ